MNSVSQQEDEDIRVKDRKGNASFEESAFSLHKQRESRFWSLERLYVVRCFGRSSIPRVGRLEQARCFLLQRGQRQTLPIVSVPFQNLIGKIKKTIWKKVKQEANKNKPNIENNNKALAARIPTKQKDDLRKIDKTLNATFHTHIYMLAA